MTKRLALRGEASYNFFGSQPSSGASLSSFLAGSGAYFFNEAFPSGQPDSNGVNYQTSTPNRVFVIPFYLPYSIQLRNVSIGVGAASAGDSINVAFYDFSKNILVDSGPFSTTVGATVLTNAISVNLTGGVFIYYAFAVTSVTPTFGATVVLGAGGGIGSTLAQREMFFGSNVLAAGAMPATLGNLTSIALVRQPMALWTT